MWASIGMCILAPALAHVSGGPATSDDNDRSSSYLTQKGCPGHLNLLSPDCQQVRAFCICFGFLPFSEFACLCPVILFSRQLFCLLIGRKAIFSV